MISKIKNAKPEAVYYGGEYPQAGPLSQQAKSAGLKSRSWVATASKTRPTSSWRARPPKVTSRPQSARRQSHSRRPSSSSADYQAAGYKEPYAAYGAYSYDAANAIINALKTSLASASDAKSARAGDDRCDEQGQLRRRNRQGRLSTSSATRPIRC